jgi:hypothetical protein
MDAALERGNTFDGNTAVNNIVESKLVTGKRFVVNGAARVAAQQL